MYSGALKIPWRRDFLCARRTPGPLFMEWSAALRLSSTESIACEYLEKNHLLWVRFLDHTRGALICVFSSFFLFSFPDRGYCNHSSQNYTTQSVWRDPWYLLNLCPKMCKNDIPTAGRSGPPAQRHRDIAQETGPLIQHFLGAGEWLSGYICPVVKQSSACLIWSIKDALFKSNRITYQQRTLITDNINIQRIYYYQTNYVLVCQE